jgi:hypothetical protein
VGAVDPLVGDWNYSADVLRRCGVPSSPWVWRIEDDGRMFIVGPEGQYMTDLNGVVSTCAIPEKQCELIRRGILVRVA